MVGTTINGTDQAGSLFGSLWVTRSFLYLFYLSKSHVPVFFTGQIGIQVKTIFQFSYSTPGSQMESILARPDRSRKLGLVGLFFYS